LDSRSEQEKQLKLILMRILEGMLNDFIENPDLIELLSSSLLAAARSYGR